MLSSEQIKTIHDQVNQGGITIPTLKDDLVDHLCCETERMMAEGESFESCLPMALNELAPEGLRDIERKTIFLLNPLKITMRKIMYSIGLVTTISMTMGLMMKLLHMRGGEQLVNYGFLTFALMFLPMVAIKKFRRNEYRRGYEKLKSLFGFLSAVGVGLAVLFKIALQLEISGLLLMTAVSTFSFGFLPLLFYGLYKESLKSPEKA